MAVHVRIMIPENRRSCCRLFVILEIFPQLEAMVPPVDLTTSPRGGRRERFLARRQGWQTGCEATGHRVDGSRTGLREPAQP